MLVRDRPLSGMRIAPSPSLPTPAAPSSRTRDFDLLRSHHFNHSATSTSRPPNTLKSNQRLRFRQLPAPNSFRYVSTRARQALKIEAAPSPQQPPTTKFVHRPSILTRPTSSNRSRRFTPTPFGRKIRSSTFDFNTPNLFEPKPPLHPNTLRSQNSFIDLRFQHAQPLRTEAAASPQQPSVAKFVHRPSISTRPTSSNRSRRFDLTRSKRLDPFVLLRFRAFPAASNRSQSLPKQAMRQ
jgi:hypothetical protein